eukprot:scaffold16501_cov72-Phaeocystis_antarctica.AAC.8
MPLRGRLEGRRRPPRLRALGALHLVGPRPRHILLQRQPVLRRARTEARAATARSQHRVRCVLLDAVAVVGLVRARADVAFGRALLCFESLCLAAHGRHPRGVVRLDRAHLRRVAGRPWLACRRVLHPLRRRRAERAARTARSCSIEEPSLLRVRAWPRRVDACRLHLQCSCRERAERAGARAARAAIRTCRAASQLARCVWVVGTRVSETLLVPPVPLGGRLEGCTCTALCADAPGRLVRTGTRCLRSSVGTRPQRCRVQRRALRRRWGWSAPIRHLRREARQRLRKPKAQRFGIIREPVLCNRGRFQMDGLLNRCWMAYAIGRAAGSRRATAKLARAEKRAPLASSTLAWCLRSSAPLCGTVSKASPSYLRSSCPRWGRCGSHVTQQRGGASRKASRR